MENIYQTMVIVNPMQTEDITNGLVSLILQKCMQNFHFIFHTLQRIWMLYLWQRAMLSYFSRDYWYDSFQERPWDNSILGYSLTIELFSFIIIKVSETLELMCEFFSSHTQEKTMYSVFQCKMIIPLFFSMYFKYIFIFHH